MHEELIILFGSQVRGTQSRESDFDVAILGNQPFSLEQKIKFARQIANILNTKEDKIDVIDLLSASPLLQYKVATTGRLLKGEKAKFIRFQVLAWKRYLDTVKFRRFRKQKLLKQYVK